MSFAFGTIVLFLIVSPGLLFKINYNTTEYSKKVSNRSVLDELILAIIPSIFLHIFGLWLAKEITGYTILYNDFGKILIGIKNENTIDLIINNFQKNITPIAIYCIWINLMAIFIGHTLRIFIRFAGFDIKYRILRFTNKWTYLLKGDSLQFPQHYDTLNIKYLIDFIMVDAIVWKEDETIIYTGILNDFYTNRDGELETIVIDTIKEIDSKQSQRNNQQLKLFGSDEVQNEKIQDGDVIEGTQFVIPYSEIKSLNLKYYTITSPDYKENVQFSRNLYKIADNLNYFYLISIFLSIMFLISGISCVFIDNTHIIQSLICLAAIGLIVLGLKILRDYYYRLFNKEIDYVYDKGRIEPIILNRETINQYLWQ